MKVLRGKPAIRYRMKLMVAAHCLLNPEVRVRGVSGARLNVKEHVLQLPCPEYLYFGPLRWEVSREQLDFRRYREFCRGLFLPIADMLEQDKHSEITIVGVSKSPSCAAQLTTVGYRGGRIRETPHEHTSGMGIFFQEIEKELKERGIRAEFQDA